MKEAQSKVQALDQEDQVLENVQHELASRLHSLLQRHRAQQRSFMDKLSKASTGEDADPIDTPDFEESVEVLEGLDYLELQRSESIQKLVSDLRELASLFEDLARLVLTQGSMLDRIDYNLSQAAEETSKGVVQLAKVPSSLG
jgi:syntaxin 16